MKVNVVEFNRTAWDLQVDEGNPWTQAVTPQQVKEAKRGNWKIVLTPKLPVPAHWFPKINGCRILCLASGGGQQGPILAAAGAEVTVFDNSPKQLEQDLLVAAREGLQINTFQGDMADLSAFANESFDLIVHPVSNCFVEDPRPVWREAFRVLAPGGSLLSGFANPILYATDQNLEQVGVIQLKFKIPYSDLTSVTRQERAQFTKPTSPLEFGHSLNAQIGGQLEAGFVIAGFYEDGKGGYPIKKYIPAFLATRAIKLT